MALLLPSFYTLYHQGRFREHASPGGVSTIHHQGERFAVACLAFVLKHDLAFLAAFLERVCGEKERKTSQFAIHVELKNGGDLVLECDSDSGTSPVAYVLECKIRAPLQDNQRPDSNIFHTTGYGQGILSHYRDTSSKRWHCTYITLTQDSLKWDDLPNLRCQGREWSCLLGAEKRDGITSLVPDLFSAFAQLGIVCFAAWNMNTNHLNLTDRYFAACEIAAVINNTGSLLKTHFDFGVAPELDATLSTEEESYIGRVVRCRNAAGKWLELTGLRGASNKESLAWYGYSWRSVQVGFFCKEDRAEKAHALLEKIKQPGEQAGSEEGYAWINISHTGTTGDQEWLLSVFERLNSILPS